VRVINVVILVDTNPQSGATIYPDMPFKSTAHMNCVEDNEPCVGCPVCQTDGCLSDYIDYWAKMHNNRSIITDVIIKLSDKVLYPFYSFDGTNEKKELANLKRLMFN